MSETQIQIRYVEQTEGSRCLRYLAKAWVALMDAGLWSPRETLVTGAEQAVYAVADKKIVGIVAFHVDGEWSTVSVGFVSPEYRSKGVYRKLKAAYEAKSREMGAKTLITICKPTNLPIQELCKKTGYVCNSTEWRKTL